jgi:hypothetical protein
LDRFEFRTERQAAEGVTILSHAVREKEMAMAKSKQFMQSPRIEVALLPDDNGDIDNPSSLFDIWMILHVPDDKNPEGIRVDGGRTIETMPCRRSQRSGWKWARNSPRLHRGESKFHSGTGALTPTRDS